MKYLAATFKILFFGSLSLLFSSLIIYGTITSIPRLAEIISKSSQSEILFALFYIPFLIFIDLFCILKHNYPISSKPKWYLDLCSLIIKLLGVKVPQKSSSEGKLPSGKK